MAMAAKAMPTNQDGNDARKSAGTAIGTYMVATQGFTSSVYPLEIFGVTVPGYAALYSVLINFLVSAALSPLLDLLARRGAASTAR